MQYVKDNPINGLVYTQIPIVLYLYNASRQYASLPVSRPPMHVLDEHHFASGTGEEQLRRWLADADTPHGAYLIWFHHAHNLNSFDYGAAEMRGMLELEAVEELADGVIFKINKTDAPRYNRYLSTFNSISRGDSGVPVARSTFDIHFDGTMLVYLNLSVA